MNDIILEGRLVAGHPMNFLPLTEKDSDVPKMKRDGINQRHECFFMLAVPKTGETEWKATWWGQVLVNVALAAYSRGEPGRPAFSWKVEDGDGTEANANGKRPCDQEGRPGHWIITCKTELKATPCFHAGKYDSMDQIREKDKIKCGDFCRVSLEIAGNGTSAKAAQTPGVYVNPRGFSLERAGTAIISEGAFNAVSAFGAPAAPVAPPVPVAAPVAPPVPVAAPVAPPPAHDFVVGPPAEKSYVIDDKPYTETVLRGQGYTDAHFATLPVAP